MATTTICHLPTAVSLIECPRDAMQGWPHFIPTQKKIEYLKSLLGIGFSVLDCGSFVSAKAIPQMADTHEVLQNIDLKNTNTKLLTIVANLRGAMEAVPFKNISYLGFPFSVSPTFQQKNTNSSMAQSFANVQTMQNLCTENGKELVVYLSMAFGNPYGDFYNENMVMEWAEKMINIGIKTISLADTVGLATAEQVGHLLEKILPITEGIQVGVHLHSTPTHWQQKMDAALQAGCTRFDGAFKGIGGCPMAGNDLVGNMDTELMIHYFEKKQLWKPKSHQALQNALKLAEEIFMEYDKIN